MDPALIGLIGIAVLIVIFLLGMPVAFAMALVGVIGFSVIKNPEAGLDLLARDFWSTWSGYSLTVIPMFVFMGSVAYYAGMGSRLYAGAYTLFGRLRGGLAMATVVATAGFSAICGSTSATAAAMGKVAIPEMRGKGYDPGLACGCTAAAGSLGILIPPSTIFIIYGILTEQSIGRLFVAGVIPGLILAGFFIFAVWIWTRFKPESAPAGGKTTIKEKLQGAIGVLEMLLVAGATVFGHFMAVSGIPSAASDFFSGLPIPAMATMILILLMYLISGCFMDSLALVTLTVPILYPTVLALGFDPIWFGVIIVVVVEMGVITPPVGINVYIIKGVVPDVRMGQIFKGAVAFLVAMVILAVLLVIFPILATWLPSFATY